MSNAKVTYTGDGTTDTFTVPFPYLDRHYITTNINGVSASDRIFLTDTQVQLFPTPPSGSRVDIYRTTPLDPYVNFHDGSVIRADDLNNGLEQPLDLLGELQDRILVLQADLENAQLTGSGLPTSGGTNSVPVYNGTSWVSLSPANFKTALGLNNFYIKATQRKAYNVGLGSYPTGEVWVQRPLTNLEVDETSSASIDSDGLIHLPAGKYRINLTVYWNIESHIAARIKNSAGTLVIGPVATFSDRSTSNAVEATGEFILASADTLRVETAAAGYDNSPGSQGLAHGIADFGDNIFTVLQLWKV